MTCNCSTQVHTYPCPWCGRDQTVLFSTGVIEAPVIVFSPVPVVRFALDPGYEAEKRSRKLALGDLPERSVPCLLLRYESAKRPHELRCVHRRESLNLRERVRAERSRRQFTRTKGAKL